MEQPESEFQSWMDLLPSVVKELDPRQAGRMLTVSKLWERTIRDVWKIKTMCMENGMNIAIWVEVNGMQTQYKWRSGVVVATGSLKFMKYIRQLNVELLCAQEIADQCDKKTLMDVYAPLMYHPEIRKRLRM